MANAGSPEPVATLRLLKIVAWPGGGLQLTVSAVGDQQSTDIRLLREDGSSSSLQVSPLSEPTGITAIVIAPASNGATHSARLEAVRALVDALPAHERVGIWLGSGSLPLLSELTDQREHVLARVMAISPTEPEAVATDAWSLLARRLMHVSAPYGSDARSLVLVGIAPPSAPELSELARGRTAFTTALLGEDARIATQPADLSQRWTAKRTATQAGVELARDVEALRARILRVGSCDAFAPTEPLALEQGDERLQFEAPPTSPELASLPCDPEQIARDQYPIGERVTFELTPEELATHDRYAADQDETEFTLNVRLGDSALVPARAHFRGQTSLNCGRKSYSVHFIDDAPRRLGQTAYGSEFYLLSLCKDPGGFRQVLANRIMSRLGLFPLEQRYVQLRVADREHGVYLLIEKPDEYLKRNQFALSALIRRRFEATGEPVEVKVPKPARDPEGAAAAVASYQAAVGATASELESSSPRLDVDSYLRWLALQSFFQCGDYVDETFFYASEEDGAPYFRNLGWDTDDLYEACHHSGKYSYRDERELAYCAEAPLDRTLLVSPDLSQRYAQTLRDLMRTELEPDRVADELASVRGDLLGRLTEDGICVGTGEYLDGQPATCERFRPWVESEMEEFVANMRARADVLRQRLHDYGVEP